jgi:hypothetical protein
MNVPVIDELLELEERFWKGDAEYYRQNLSSDAVMVFAEPIGTMTKDAIVASIRDSPRWRHVVITDAQALNVSADAILLIYSASASRSDTEPPYITRASSLYVLRDAEWKMAFHQQTPGPPAS